MNYNPSAETVLKYNELVYYLFFALMFGARAAGLNEGNAVYSIIFAVSMILFLLKIAATEHTVGEYVFVGAFLLLAMVVYFRTGEKGLLLCFAMMLGMKKVCVKNVFRIGTFILAVFFSVKVFLSVFGFINELFYYQERAGMGGDFRHALGYPHPNSLQLNCFILVMLIMFLIGKRNKRRVLLASCIMLGISMYIFLYSGSRTGLLITIVYLIVNYYLLYRSEFSKTERILIQLVYPVCACTSVLIPFAGSQKWIDWISGHMDTIGSRVIVARYYFDLVPISLFGSRIEITKDFAYGIDMGYPYLLLVLGVVAFVIFGVIYIMFIHNCLKTDHRSELAVTLSIVLMGILEPFLFNLSFKNLSLVFLGQYLFILAEQVQTKGSVKVTFLNRHIQLFGWGSRTVSENGPVGALMKSCRNWQRAFSGFVHDYERIRKSMIFFFVSAVLVSAVFFSSVKKPSAVYTDSDRSERTELNLVPIELTEQEASEIRKNGDILIHYEGAGIPMYRYEGIVALNEYLRRMVSCGVWSGIGMALAYNMYIAFHKKSY